jgi:hypothetical protein
MTDITFQKVGGHALRARLKIVGDRGGTPDASTFYFRERDFSESPRARGLAQ